MLMKRRFVNRRIELDFLETRFEKERAEFIIIYGRRRVGKTELIKQFIRGKKSVYHLVSRETEKDQLSEFHRSLAGTFPELSDIKEDWEILFKQLRNKERHVLVIDEYQHLIETNPEILRRFQKIWDEYLVNTDIFLILSGSSVGMMETEVLGYKSPLYGRRTGQWKMEPFGFFDIRDFFPDHSVEDLITTYAVLGGIPYYLEQFAPEKSVEENVLNEVLKRGAVLREESVNLLREELREPKNYFSVLKAISSGKTKFNEISNVTGIKKNSLSKYLLRLQDLHLIRKRLPVTKPENSRRGRYYIEDNYLDFWFRFVFPNRSFIERDPELFLNDVIVPALKQYTSGKFEDVCREYLSIIEQTYSKIGSWWYREEEIDVVAVNERGKRILFGECKWSDNRVGYGLLMELREKAKSVRWLNEKRREEYVLFSRAGFSKELQRKEGEDEKLLLVDLVDFEAVFK